MVTYALLSNTLLLTVLVAILGNTFATINADAAAEVSQRSKQATWSSSALSQCSEKPYRPSKVSKPVRNSCLDPALLTVVRCGLQLSVTVQLGCCDIYVADELYPESQMVSARFTCVRQAHNASGFTN
jgi:hypothetical protein